MNSSSVLGRKNHHSGESHSDSSKFNWTIEDSEKLYRIASWGEPYFSINAAGHVTVSPQGDRGGSLDLLELVEALKLRNVGLPLLIRFSDILADRIERLHACFAKAIARYNYPGTYRGVYPVKCNQHRHLLEALVEFGKPYQFGVEAGSKPELAIALATLEPVSNYLDNSPNTLLICNGYKDREYIETALLATRLGHFPVIVIEQLEELPLVIDIAQKLCINPVLGVRAKLSTQGTGRWGKSSGDRAKFGLTIPQILSVVNQLAAAEMLNCLQLLHFHIGSQISNISVIKDAIREASQIYVQLTKLGAKMQYLDVGGGLGVDYDGSKTNFHASKNYNMQNYANDIVAEVKEACEETQIAAPVLISESGRAIASHQSVLIFDVLGTNDVPSQPPQPIAEKEHLIIRNLWETYTAINSENYQEAYHDAIQFKEEAISLFNFGYLSLAERARAEQLYWACCQQILEISRQQEYVPDDLEDLEKIMASIYYINLSVFQSAPDTWAIDQLFPIMPIHRLNEEPTQRGILADLTCDSDGKIDQFIDLRDIKDILELHPLVNKSETKPETVSASPSKQPYYLGMFLVGAYQEIMGNLHNLFGDTNAVHISMTPKGYQIEHLVKGDTVAEVLGYVQYNAEDLLERIRRRTEQALQENRITIAESQRLLQNYERSLNNYTYLSS
ncbi:biosynthetic arginine decarboxylase [Oscillatoria salina]|uniref:biosynthetic arginine decarboxylase n=1 Tax=Oscillatoria salina TaxID=331517 RepID=UPI0013B70C6C|nr:biosynthetic arginine decarboxylase [Oscillatoria salina]MBZ8178925.1 biosynthetic arginine decarboxylase [Oscillatoria salina IIICB1]NET86649.1 biosynthetic arginine decarboxylase [Kamptonema sp. SIO1D9]